MDKVSLGEEKTLERIKAALSKHIKDFEIHIDEDSTSDFQHYIVISDDFKKYGHLKKQEYLWKILRKEIGDEGLLKVTRILTYTKDEADKLLVG